MPVLLEALAGADAVSGIKHQPHSTPVNAQWPRVLEKIEFHKYGCTPLQVSECLDINYETTYRIMRRLEHVGLLERRSIGYETRYIRTKMERPPFFRLGW